jgi:hypothetical protein
MKVAVIGRSGFVGRAAYAALEQQGHLRIPPGRQFLAQVIGEQCGRAGRDDPPPAS